MDNSAVKKCVLEKDLNVPTLHFNIGSNAMMEGIKSSPWKSRAFRSKSRSPQP